VDGGNSGAVHWALPVGEPVGSGVQDGAWHFIAATWDTDTMSIYIDGALNISKSHSGGWAVVHQPFDIGAVPDNGNRIFDGSMSQVAVFGTALSAAQIQALYYAAEVLPYITQQPANTVVAQGNTATLSVTANGTPSLAYQWYEGTLPVSNSGDYSGATTATLTISDARMANSGSYSMVVTNLYGAVTSAVATVTVTPAPFIVSEPSPTNITLYAGSQVNYSLGVVGNAPLVFQWYNLKYA
jgi:hypothetical protein